MFGTPPAPSASWIVKMPAAAVAYVPDAQWNALIAKAGASGAIDAQAATLFANDLTLFTIIGYGISICDDIKRLPANRTI